MGYIFNRGQSPGNRQRRDYWGISSPLDLVPTRSTGRAGLPVVSNDTAMRQSAVWAAVRLRADLISTMPLRSYRNLTFEDGVSHKVPADLSPFMADPDFMEWRYSSQVELDRSGNSVGIITDTYSNGLPAAIELQPSAGVTVFYKDGKLKYRIGDKEYDPDVIWHEKQYTVSGLPVGLSPVAYAAWTLGQYRTIQEFASDWFMAGTLPRAQLKNAAKKLNFKEATVVKEAWRASRAADEPFVTGNDWEYSLIQAQQSASEWIEAMKMSLEDAARFFGVPADLIDAQTGGPNITYANITQRNLQFLIMHLGPAIRRRENAYGKLLPRPRLVEHDTDSLLRMDPETLANTIRTKIDSRVIAPNEARELDNRAPFTEEQIIEFDRLGLNRRNSTPSTSLAPIPPTQDILDAVNEQVTGKIGATSPLVVPPAPKPAPDNSQGNNPNG